MAESFDSSDSVDFRCECKRLNTENQRLIQINSAMSEEIQNLKIQFDEISKINNSLEVSNLQNNKLSEEVRKCQNEKDEISRRLQISLEMIDDLKDKIEHEKMTNLLLKNQINRNFNQEKKEESKSEIFEKQNLKERLNKCEVQLRRVEADLQLERKKLLASEDLCQKLFLSVQSYFRRTFSSVDCLIDFLKFCENDLEQQNYYNANNTNTKIEDNNDNLKIRSLVSMVKKLRIKIKKESDSKMKIENDYKLLEEQSKNQIQALKNEIAILKNQVTEYERQSSMFDLQSRSILETRDQKISKTKKQNELLKQQVNELNAKIQKLNEKKKNDEANQSVNNDISASNYNQCQSCSVLQDQLSSVVQEKEQIKLSHNELYKLNNNLKTENDNLALKNKKQSNEITQLKIMNDDLESKLNAATSQDEALKAKLNKLQTDKNEVDGILKRNELTISQFERNYNNQKQDLQELYDHRNTLIEMIYKLQEVIQSEENLIDNLIKSKKETNKKYKLIKKEKQQLEQKCLEYGSNIDKEVIPATSWFCQDFDQDLCDRISEFAGSEILPITAKLKHVLLVIARYYNNKSKDETEKIAKIKNEKDELIESITTLLQGISSVLEISGYDDINTISSPIKVSELLNIIRSQKALNANSEKPNQIYENIVSQLTTKFHIDKDNLVNKIDSFLGSYDDQKEKVLLLQKKLRIAQKMLKDEKGNFDKIVKEKDVKLMEKAKKIADLTNMNESLATNLARAESSVASLNSSIIRNRDREENNENTHQIKNHKKQIENLKNKIRNLKALNQNSVSEMEGRNIMLSSQIEKLEKDVEFWKQNANLLRNTQAQKEQEIQKMQFQFEKYEDEIKQQNIKEVNTIRIQYETIIEKLKSKNQELRGITDELSTDFKKVEKGRDSLQKKLQTIEAEKDQLEAKVEMLSESEKRNKQIIEQKIRAAQLALETKRQNEISDIKSAFEVEKRKIFSFAVKSFSKFFNANKNLDEKSYKETIERSSAELERLIAQDAAIRRLLGITPSESPEMCISQLLLSLYHQT